MMGLLHSDVSCFMQACIRKCAAQVIEMTRSTLQFYDCIHLLGSLRLKHLTVILVVLVQHTHHD